MKAKYEDLYRFALDGYRPQEVRFSANNYLLWTGREGRYIMFAEEQFVIKYWVGKWYE